MFGQKAFFERVRRKPFDRFTVCAAALLDAFFSGFIDGEFDGEVVFDVVVQVVLEGSIFSDGDFFGLIVPSEIFEKDLQFFGGLCKDMQIDIASSADVSCCHRADDGGLKGRELAHDTQSNDAHRKQPLCAFLTLDKICVEQESIADLPVGREILGAKAEFVSCLAKESFGSHALGDKVFFHAFFVHQASGFLGDTCAELGLLWGL